MDSKIMGTPIQKEITRGTGETTTTTPEFLRGRLLLYFGFGVIASLFLLLADQLLFARHGDVSFSTFSSYYDALFLAHPASFLLGLVLVYFIRRPVRTLQFINFWVLTLNILLVTFSFAVFDPGLPPTFPLALMLFLQAALIPGRVWCQLSLGLVAVISMPLTEAWAYFSLPEVHQFWILQGSSNLFWSSLVSHTVDVSILAGLAVLITYTLYNFRKDLSKARRMGNYIIKGEIGRGGMGTVYEASHTFLKRPTAIKVMMPQEGDAQTAVARFEKEVTLSASLTHPNTITIFDYGHCSHYSFYYAMELLEGMDLEKFVKKFGPLSPNRAAHILSQVCGSLGEAHRRGIIHRDIKPSNIFLTQQGGLYDFVKVLDFGLAKEIQRGTNRDASITKAGSLLGTPRYIAPESVHSKGTVDGRTDIYMLGSVAYWILTGHPPFEGSSSVDLIVDHVKTTPKRPSELSEIPIPKELDDIVMKCLEKNPEDRFQTPDELSRALEAIAFTPAWMQSDAREWWALHLQKEDVIPTLQPQETIPGGEYQPAKAAVG